MPTFADKIRAAIARSGLSQYALADKSGVPQSRISGFLAGGSLRLENAEALCKVVGLDLREAPKGRRASTAAK